MGTDFGLTTSISCCLLIFVPINFGHFLQSEMLSERERTHQKMISRIGQVSFCSQLLQQTKWFLSWRFQLSAKGIHVIDHSFIPCVAGTAITYIIFLFQLAAEEMDDLHKSVFTNNSTVLLTKHYN
ncbi:unnamed protein product [Allacma fusca]|uniref:Uncharacterized protein n=1 Tax=Allacma fusca TaxID=39272 RepID=A0A8J2KW11_9HEXA|nr:unnamed protein product [Allacma fusca]